MESHNKMAESTSESHNISKNIRVLAFLSCGTIKEKEVVSMKNKLRMITEATLIVGVDIAKKIHWSQVTDYRGNALCKPIKVENTFEGFQEFLHVIKEICGQIGCKQILLGFEPSGHYWKNLAYFLESEENIILLGVNPFHVKQMKELDDNTQTKSDKKDALVIARLIRDGRFFEIYLPEEKYAQLRILRRYREQASIARKRLICNIKVLMDEYFPEYEKVGYEVSSISARAILRTTPFPKDLIEMEAEEIWNKWRMALGKTMRIGRQKVYQLKEEAMNSIGIKVGIEAARVGLNTMLDQMDILDASIEKYDAEMEMIMNELDISIYLTSVPGVGKVTAAAFVAETGDLSRFDDWKQVRKMAGLNLVEQSSGMHKGKTSISKRGRPGLRKIIYIIGDKGMLVSPEMMMYYQYLRHRPSNQLAHQQAVLAVGLKLMRVMFHVAKIHESYDAQKVLGEIRINQINSLSA